jgi:hypothetical protein
MSLNFDPKAFMPLAVNTGEVSSASTIGSRHYARPSRANSVVRGLSVVWVSCWPDGVRVSCCACPQGSGGLVVGQGALVLAQVLKRFLRSGRGPDVRAAAGRAPSAPFAGLGEGGRINSAGSWARTRSDDANRRFSGSVMAARGEGPRAALMSWAAMKSSSLRVPTGQASNANH